MNKTILILSIFFTTLSCFSQKTTRIDHYVLPTGLKEEKLILMEMPFGKTDIVKLSGDSISINENCDIYIDIICTDYPANQSLHSLNNNRLKVFFKRFPKIQRARVVQVSCFRQLDGAEKEKALDMFHGLVIRYRPTQSAAAMQVELEALEEMLITVKVDSAVNVAITENVHDSILQKLKLKKGSSNAKDKGPAKYASSAYDMCVTGYVGYKHFPDDSSVNISPKQALRKKMITKAAYKAYEWTPMVTLFFRRIDSAASKPVLRIPKKELTIKDTLREVKTLPLPDSTLFKILARNTWRNFTVVEDVTVSMYPYSAQLLLWLRMHSVDSVSNSYVFFNDGNDMPDAEKKTGATGGIYLKNCSSFEQVKKLIKETMANGSGGDRAENDIEALLEGEKEFPEKDFQVLIADNKAPIKDKALYSKLKKPVRVIVCGADDYNLNVDYLNLARITKGSVHLVQQDILELAALREGEVITIGKKGFRIEAGFFVETGKEE